MDGSIVTWPVVAAILGSIGMLGSFVFGGTKAYLEYRKSLPSQEASLGARVAALQEEVDTTLPRVMKDCLVLGAEIEKIHIEIVHLNQISTNSDADIKEAIKELKAKVDKLMDLFIEMLSSSPNP